MNEPFQPGKIPVVLVHGLASSPLTWSHLQNELRTQPGVLDRYQVWTFRYDTGSPFLTTAAELRRQLAELRRIYDPCGADPNMRLRTGAAFGQAGYKPRLHWVCSWHSALSS